MLHYNFCAALSVPPLQHRTLKEGAGRGVAGYEKGGRRSKYLNDFVRVSPGLCWEPASGCQERAPLGGLFWCFCLPSWETLSPSLQRWDAPEVGWMLQPQGCERIKSGSFTGIFSFPWSTQGGFLPFGFLTKLFLSAQTCHSPHPWPWAPSAHDPSPCPPLPPEPSSHCLLQHSLALSTDPPDVRCGSARARLCLDSAPGQRNWQK